jgi:hypothetical protein
LIAQRTAAEQFAVQGRECEGLRGGFVAKQAESLLQALPEIVIAIFCDPLIGALA